MKKILLLLCLYANSSFGQYNLLADTTISGTWTLGSTILYVAPGVKIHGTGSITGGYVNASFYQNIFDTSVNASGIKGGSGSIISTTWFGASPSNVDNSPFFQKAIKSAINKDMTLYMPAGSYNDSLPLYILDSTAGGYFNNVTIKIVGDYRRNSATLGTQINYKGITGGAIEMQRSKGVRIQGIAFNGRFVSPSSSNLNTYYNITYDNYKDANGLCTNLHSGIQIDPFTPSSGNSGSTSVDIYDCSFNKFTVGVYMSPNSTTLNCEEITIDHCFFGDMRSAVVGTQAQEKDNIIRDCMSWGTSFCFFSDGNYADGRGQAGYYHIYDINIAGLVSTVFYVNARGWFPLKADHIVAESIGSIGTLATQGNGSASSSTGMGIEIYACTFTVVDPAISGIAYMANTNSKTIMFRGCDFTYYDGSFTKSMQFNGAASFDNCNFMGVYSNVSGGSVFYPSCKFTN